MDRGEALALLTGGAAGIGEWNRLCLLRETAVLRTPAVPSLEGAPLRGASLMRANLDHVNLQYADLSGADLSGCSLVVANLTGANCQGSNFALATMMGTMLNRANLRYARFICTSLLAVDVNEAPLGGADFREASFIDVYFHGADLAGAIFDMTTISSNLALARNLDEARHRGPSYITTNALQSLAARPPVRFLRGCGLSDLEIETLTALSTSPIQYYSAFISYSSKDDAFAVKLHDALQARGVRCWLDKHAILPGDSIRRAVNEGIRLWDKVLLCCSEHALKSWWVKDEVTCALEKEQRLEKERGMETLAIIPLDLDGQLFADDGRFEYGATLRKRHAARFAGWDKDEKLFDAQVERVVKALRAGDGVRATAPSSRL